MVRKLPSASAIAEQQEQEIEVLHSILDTDFVKVPPRSVWKNAPARLSEFEITLRPEDDSLKAQVSALMVVKLPKTYPYVHPIISIQQTPDDKRTKGVSSTELRKLDAHIQHTCSELPLGTEMIWEVVSQAQEYISNHHGIGELEKSMLNISLGDQMRLRAQEAEQARLAAQEAARQVQSKEEQERAKALADAIRLEEERKAEEMERVKERQGTHLSSVTPGTPAVFRTQETTPGNSVLSTGTRVERFLDAIATESDPIHLIRVGPIVAIEALRTLYLADSAQPRTDAKAPVSWTLLQYDICSPHYSTLTGKKQLEELEWELERLRSVRSEHLLNVLATSLTRGSEDADESLQGWKLLILTEQPGGPSLREVLEQCDTLPWSKVRDYTRALLSGLQLLHTNSLVHRALSPDVIFLTRRRSRPSVHETSLLKIADASYQKRLEDMHSQAPFHSPPTTELPGNVPNPWRPPETLSGAPYSRSQDTWDLGRLLCQMLFGLDCTQHADSPASLLDDYRDGKGTEVATDVRHFVRSLMNPNPRKRPTAKAALATLEELIKFEDTNQMGSSTLAGSKHLIHALRKPSPLNPSMQLLGTSPDAQFNRLAAFWQADRMPTVEPSARFSRYVSDFEEIEFLGKGAFGSVVKARNKLDGRFYAIKKIRLSDSAENDERTLREVTALSRLNHAHIVRYVTCWIEQEVLSDGHTTESSTSGAPLYRPRQSVTGSDEREAAADNFSFRLNFEADLDADFLSVGHDALSKNASYQDIKFGGDDSDEESSSDDSGGSSAHVVSSAKPSTNGMKDIWSRPGITSESGEAHLATRRTLFIQMEYISGSTLRDVIDKGLSVEESWRIFRQMLEALSHINYSMGVIHRDLKPSNVMMSGDAEVKIGDFGLATTDVTRALEDSTDGENMVQSTGDLTSDVGTNLYIAPEVIKKVGRYDAKVDMYSLGVIFFEMLASQRAYTTGMERVAVLRELRTEEITLPSAWPFDDQAPQTKIVRWLLNHRAEARPSPMELLKSDLLPLKLEDEYIDECLRLMTNTSSTYHDRLLGALFGRSDVDDVRDFTFDMGAELDADTSLTAVICDHMRVIFQRHGAVQSRIPPLVPPNELYVAQAEDRKLVRMLDRSGLLVYLPFDGLLPFARAFKDTQTKRFKRYDISTVYRDNPIAGGQPRSVMEVNFDVITPERTPAQEAEVFKVLQELIEEVPGLKHDWVIQLNHRAVLDLILERVPKQRHAAVGSTFAATLSIKQTPTITQNLHNKLLDLQLTRSVIEELNAANLSGSVSDVQPRLERLLPSEHKKLLRAAVDELASIISAARSLGVHLPILFTPLLAQNASYFKGGVIFQLVRVGKKRLDVLAAGGRYDYLLKRFANPGASSSSPPPHGVGVQIAVGKVALALSRYQELQVPHLMSKAAEEERSLGWWTPRRCDVYVVGGQAGALEAVMDVCRELWSFGICADFESGTLDVPPERLAAACKAEGILLVVTVRARHTTLKVRNVLHRQDVEVDREELVSWLQEHLMRQRMVDQQQLGNQQLLHLPAGHSTGGGPGALHVTSPLPTSSAGGFGSYQSSPYFSSRGASAAENSIICQVVMPSLKYPGVDKYGRGNKDRRQSKSSKQAIIDKATRDAQRIGDDVLRGRMPIIAIDMGSAEMQRFAGALSLDANSSGGGGAGGSASGQLAGAAAAGGGGTGDAMRAHLDTLQSTADRDYAKLVKNQIFATLSQGATSNAAGSARVILYSVRDERSVIVQL
ncbi:Serine/threonine-protein kinase [Tilletiaria anomala UBC 951]|uniref:non-specific serine/threonine protein kinase n=1 Tax=Tilletiaria anomala (strain ATCC 24038 / CBS 436.72 / UBC 951) TaxID=1037660 RepID=A0A066VT60_TILAU|nr:Serine/threonine-protein kinase [Tilletiaria anomala UBC 951]KDN44887.1 Serine/threonine-protein kinase [Tilletiaria anomala UBC 951]